MAEQTGRLSAAAVCLMLAVYITGALSVSIPSIRIDTSSGIFTIQRDPDEKGPRLLPCMTYVSVGELQAEDLRLEWYRAESNSHRERISNYTSIASDLWRSKVAYPTDIRCQQIPSQTYPQYFDCSLTIPHFTEDFTDYYKCEVVYFMEGVKVSEDSRELRLESIQSDDDKSCFMPEAYNLSLVVHEQNDSFITSASLYWNVTTKPDRAINCRGARRWQVRSVTFDNVYVTPEDNALNDLAVPPGDPEEWQDTEQLRGQYFHFTSGLDLSKYFVFQVQNDANDDARAEHPKIRQYGSYVYYFGQQAGARLITPGGTVSLTVGDPHTIECTAIGQPSPEVSMLSRLGSSPLSDDDGEDVDVRIFREFKSVLKSDAKEYYCFAKNILVNPPFGKRPVRDIVAIRLEVNDPPVPENLDVTCTSYSDSTCAPFIYGEVKVYINTSFTHENRSRKVEGALDTITLIQQGREQCANLAKAMVCHSAYPYCDPGAISQGKIVPRPICEHTCAIFMDRGECAGLIDPQTYPELHELLLSNCGSGDEAGNPPECHPIPLGAPEKAKNEELKKKTFSCISGNGQGYMGDLEKTMSGKDCQKWSSGIPHSHPISEMFFPQELTGAGYACRNPGGLGKKPWCYTTDPATRWEYCDIPKCEFCEPYRGTFCAAVPGFNTSLVHVDRKRSGVAVGVQTAIDRNIGGFYHDLTLQEDIVLSRGCDYALKLFLCYSALPFCSEQSDENPKKLCGDMCLLLDDIKLCPGLGEMVVSFMNGENSPLVSPECGESRGSRDSEAECLPSPARLQTNPDIPATTKCYRPSDGGHTYQGSTDQTTSGFLCQRWDTNTPHATHIKEDLFFELREAENYCRNPGQLRGAPWCFTTNVSVEWEYCDIPICAETKAVTTSDSNSDTAIYAAVFGSFGFVAIVVVVIGLAIVFYLYRTRKRLQTPPQPAQYQANSGEMKLIYNPQYFKPNCISHHIAEIMDGFPRFDKAKIKYLRQLGQGNFGVVFQGKADGLVEGENETLIAVKTLKEEASSEGLENFVHEAKLMFSFDHPNIIKIYAVCMGDLPYYMIFEYMEKGDLTQFLHSSASSIQRRYMNPFAFRSRTESQLSNNPPDLDASQLTEICRQVAAGMEYLAEKKHVHRDLACRNCLVRTVKNGFVIKIGDFGMSHNLYSRDYYKVNGQAILPVRWMSPEAVVYGKFSTAGDVWSFGVVMWEIFSFAMQPYYGTSNEQVTESIRKGRILQKPHDCPNKMYDVMKECWSMNPKERPTFTELHQILKECRLPSSSDRFPSLDSIDTLDSDAFLEENSVDGISIDMN